MVRIAGEDDLPALGGLWDECRTLGGAAVMATGALEILERVREQLRASRAAVERGDRPTYRLVYVMLDGQPVGFASFSVIERGLTTATSAVLVDVVHVDGGRRKSGVGTALLREAVLFADEVGAVDVMVNVPPTSRDVNRFYARLGFAPLVVRRTAPVGHLRRKLGVDPRLDARDATIDLTPIQRSLRRRALLTPRRTPARP